MQENMIYQIININTVIISENQYRQTEQADARKYDLRNHENELS